ncbi:hypothetical protein G9A89_004146 [Geosiphon pyriformis]|nr:hypothetical protein G9A89_004146 [Geosiphon pyriformis]
MTTERLALYNEQAQYSNDEDDNGVIRCICEYSDDDGYTIQCDECLIWQHWACVTGDDDTVPEIYLCEVCKPRPMDIKRAKEYQRSLRESDWRDPEFADSDWQDQETKDTSDHSPQEKQQVITTKSRKAHGFSSHRKEHGSGSSRSEKTIQKKQKNGKTVKQHRDMYEKDKDADEHLNESLDSDKEYNVNDYNFQPEYKKIEKNGIASKDVEELFRKILAQYQRQAQHRKRSLSFSSSSGPGKTDHITRNGQDNFETSKKKKVGNDSWPTSNDSNKDGISRGQSKSDNINLFMMERESLASPLLKTLVKKITPSQGFDPKRHTVCYGLFSETKISSGRFIFEFKGEVCLKSTYQNNPSNQYSLLGVTKPFVLFHPTVDLCVDARLVGNEARFIRRSCHPNAEARSIVVPGGEDPQIHLGIFAKSEIGKGKEITVGWDWEPNHLDISLIENEESDNTLDEAELSPRRKNMGSIAAAILKLTDCACDNPENCVLNRMQREGKLKGTKKPGKISKFSEESERLPQVSKKDLRKRSEEINPRQIEDEESDQNLETDRAGNSFNDQKKRRDNGLLNQRPRRTRKILDDDDDEEEEEEEAEAEEQNQEEKSTKRSVSVSMDEEEAPIVRRKEKKKEKIKVIEKTREKSNTPESFPHDQDESLVKNDPKIKHSFSRIDRTDQSDTKKKVSDDGRRTRADSTSSNKGKLKSGKNTLSTPYSRRPEKSIDSDQRNSSPMSPINHRRKQNNLRESQKPTNNNDEEYGVYSSSSESSLSSISNLGSSDLEDSRKLEKGTDNKSNGKSKIRMANQGSSPSVYNSSKRSSSEELIENTNEASSGIHVDVLTDQSNTSVIPSKPLMFDCHLPIKKFWAQQYLSKITIGEVPVSNATSDFVESPTHHIEEIKDSESPLEVLKSSNDHEINTNGKEDLPTTNSEQNNGGKFVVPRAAPIIPAKRLAVEEEYSQLKKDRDVNFALHVESESQSKRQKLDSTWNDRMELEGKGRNDFQIEDTHNHSDSSSNLYSHFQENNIFSPTIKDSSRDTWIRQTSSSSSSLFIASRNVSSKDFQDNHIKTSANSSPDFSKTSRPSTPPLRDEPQISPLTSPSSVLLENRTYFPSSNPKLASNNSRITRNEQSSSMELSFMNELKQQQQSTALQQTEQNYIEKQAVDISIDNTEKTSMKDDNPKEGISANPDIAASESSSVPTTPIKVKKYTVKEYKEYQERKKKESLQNGGNTDSSAQENNSNGITSTKVNDSMETEKAQNTFEEPSTSLTSSPLKPLTPSKSSTEITRHSSSPTDDYFPEDLPIEFSTTSDSNKMFTMDFASYDERGRNSPPYKESSSNKQLSDFNILPTNPQPLHDSSLPTSPRSGYTSPLRGQRYGGFNGNSGPFRGGRMISQSGSFRGPPISPGDRGRYHNSGYLGSSTGSPMNSLPSTPRQGAPSLLSSSASSPYDPANPDGHISNSQNDRDQGPLDNNNRSSPGLANSIDSKSREYPRLGGDRFDRERSWNHGYFGIDRVRERDWRDRDDSRKDWNKRPDYHYRERDYSGSGSNGSGGSELARYSIDPRRPSNGVHQDRYSLMNSGTGLRSTISYNTRRDELSNITTPTVRNDMAEMGSGSSPVPTGPAAGNDPPLASSSPLQRFGMEDYRRNRR